MIIHLDDVLEDVYKQYPLIKESSIEKVCKKGLKGINRVMRSGDELFIHGGNGQELKFFIPMTVENQAELSSYKFHTRKQKENDKKDNSNK